MEKVKKKLSALENLVKSGRIKDPQKIIIRATKYVHGEKMASFFDYKSLSFGHFEWSVKDDVLKERILQEGMYVLKTNIKDLSPKKFLESYKNLKLVEDNFKVIKSFLEIRPVYHWKKHRIIAHVFICFLAAFLLKKAELRLRKYGISWKAAAALRWLQGIELNILSFQNMTLKRVEENISSDLLEIIKALKVEKILRIDSS